MPGNSVSISSLPLAWKFLKHINLAFKALFTFINFYSTISKFSTKTEKKWNLLNERHEKFRAVFHNNNKWNEEEEKMKIKLKRQLIQVPWTYPHCLVINSRCRFSNNTLCGYKSTQYIQQWHRSSSILFAAVFKIRYARYSSGCSLECSKANLLSVKLSCNSQWCSQMSTKTNSQFTKWII